MGKAVTGFDGTVVSGSNDMNVTAFSIDIEAAAINTMNTSDAGWEDEIDGPKKVSGSFDFNYDPTNSPFASVANLLPGSGTYPTLTLKATTGQVYTGLARVSKLSLKSDVKDAKKFTATFTSKGAWTFPS
jgi:hypothetical protein